MALKFLIIVLTGSVAIISNFITSSLYLGIIRTGGPRCLTLRKTCRIFSNVKRTGRQGTSYDL